MSGAHEWAVLISVELAVGLEGVLKSKSLNNHCGLAGFWDLEMAVKYYEKAKGVRASGTMPVAGISAGAWVPKRIQSSMWIVRTILVDVLI